MLFNVLGSMLEKSAAVQTFSAIRANPGALTHVGQSVYAKAAERGFLPLAVLLDLVCSGRLTIPEVQCPTSMYQYHRCCHNFQ